MMKTYICRGCKKEYPPDDKLTCDFCGGKISVVIEKSNKETKSELNIPQQADSNSLLIKCGKCSNSFSKRADQCPKCGWKVSKECLVCRSKIKFDEIPCPKCGDPTPFTKEKPKLNSKIVPYQIKRHRENLRKIIAASIGCLVFFAGLLSIGGLRNAMDTNTIGALPAIFFLLILFVSFKLSRATYNKIKKSQAFSEPEENHE